VLDELTGKVDHTILIEHADQRTPDWYHKTTLAVFASEF
jgi:hypothetical protein